jgi:hypothetical protein
MNPQKNKKTDKVVSIVQNNKDENIKGNELVLKIADDNVKKYFKNHLNKPYVCVEIDGHYENWEVNSKKFEDFLRIEYYKRARKTPTRIKDAIRLLDATASRKDVIRLYNRVGIADNSIYYDLLSSDWKYIKIDQGKWEIIDNKNAPILFNRYSHQLPQVIPLKEGEHNAKSLLEYVNLNPESDEALLLLVYIASCFIPNIPHPILMVRGEHGSAKSSLFKMIQKIIDPTITDLIQLPAKEEELIQKVSHDWLTMYDNVSIIKEDISNILCRVATGGSSSKRKIYSVDDDFISKFKGCVALNSTGFKNNVKPDLLDRALLIELERITSINRMTEQELINGFEEDFNGIFTGFLNAVAEAMRLIDDIKITGSPRMADFYKWGTALALALGYDAGDFKNAYYKNIMKTQNINILDNPLFNSVVKFIENEYIWNGTATDLLKIVENIKDRSDKIKDMYTKNRLDWPTTSTMLSKYLNEMKNELDTYGILFNRTRNANQRQIFLKMNR